ncbi:hypothetical protein FHR32_005500 [Streptosporangium album]|uniref:Excalibur calcium-binding domain-containing protein n=1 Tax=Streptosporangium album TaxID=47479 RepID=A0A7W7S0V9_9ACTN|nr:excalibur calcium-binding domain-containing protein [Streptosporangium album]MBB4941123.1 hypothetical protein [Streptosporangium album]
MLTTGVLGTLAVLMTRDPGVPLGAPPPQRLRVPIHFAPVIGSQAGACTTPEGVPDDAGQTCYTLAAGVSVNAVRKIETVQDKGGAYSVRIAFASAFRDQINDLTQEAVKQQLAIVAGEKVVAAPLVAQVITEDSLSIAGSFTKEQAAAMVVRLGGPAGTAPPATGQPQPSQSVSSPASDLPVTPPSSDPSTATTPTPTPTTTPPAAVTTATTTPQATTVSSGARATTSVTGGPRATSSGSTTSGGREPDPRYPSCKAAIADGYGGPYTRGVHEEYYWYTDADGDGVACETGGLS